MARYRIIEKQNCFGTSKFYIQKKWLFWWVYIERFYNEFDRKPLSCDTYEDAMVCIHDWSGKKFSRVVKITEVKEQK